MKLQYRAAAGGGSEDRQFIIATWSSSYKKMHSAGLITSEDWASTMWPQFGKHLDREGARAIIACERSDPNYFYGWIAGDTTENTPVVFYVYVKEPHRRTGIARELFGALGVDPNKYFVYVCGVPIARELVPHARCNPNEIRYPKTARRRPL